MTRRTDFGRKRMYLEAGFTNDDAEHPPLPEPAAAVVQSPKKRRKKGTGSKTRTSVETDDHGTTGVEEKLGGVVGSTNDDDGLCPTPRPNSTKGEQAKTISTKAREYNPSTES
jgi:hypothetical protein